MEWGDVVSVISKAAPLVGSLFGPGGTAVGALASTGIQIAARALGVEPTKEAVTQAIATDPDAALKLAQYQMDHKFELEKLEVKRLELELGDVADARATERARTASTGKPDYNLYILAWTIIVGFFLLMGFLLRWPVPEDQNGVIFMLFGALATGFGQVLQYFFGSSKGSAEMRQQMTQLRKTVK